VHDDVIDRLDAQFEDLGPRVLKNIARPVAVWRWSPSIGSSPARHRRAAVVITDVVRFSLLMKQDAATTLATLTSVRREIIDPLTRRYRGRLVKPLGDGEMLEFPDAASAVGFAVEMHEAVALRGATEPEERRLVYKVGIGLGDVFVLDGDLLGEGVMIAHRLAALAEAGGACISDAVHREVHGKVDAELVALGERELNGVERPVLVWVCRLQMCPPNGIYRGPDAILVRRQQRYHVRRHGSGSSLRKGD
jgi:class 3 adenylate cyclase